MSIHPVRDVLDTIATYTNPIGRSGPVHVLADHMAITSAPNWEAHLLIFGTKGATFAKKDAQIPQSKVFDAQNEWLEYEGSKTPMNCEIIMSSSFLKFIRLFWRGNLEKCKLKT